MGIDRYIIRKNLQKPNYAIRFVCYQKSAKTIDYIVPQHESIDSSSKFSVQIRFLFRPQEERKFRKFRVNTMMMRELSDQNGEMVEIRME